MPDTFCTDDLIARLTLYEDADLVVLNKPAGLAVQKGTRTQEHLDGLFAQRAERTGERWRLVHRLDKATSGCLLVARNRHTAAQLSRAFMRRTIQKSYWAVVHGVPEPRSGVIDLPLVKAGTPSGDRVRVAGPDEMMRAQTASTRYEVLAVRGRRLAWLRLEPMTGRQHQIRAHLAAIGAPVVGDPLYPPSTDLDPVGSGHLHLLARGLGFRHPRTGLDVTVVAPPSQQMAETLRTWGLRREEQHEAT